ncbi:hypothetical protein PRIPAC_79042 [Pristionchus pacificus]|uniref:Uncharacterized protein n=1 Tax=Pristionchus pacificus TaxID=54126 RepID=A0A2A6CMA8_PRIPA|nr:hypothetical protein PRIPAC_79042 [Pristionchus pacificus]|eukprot:PDM79161.1 hypothetical protein PRIPAC_31740 [Pristionchus pacificus]
MGIFTIQPVAFPAKTPGTFLPMCWLIFLVAYLPALACYLCIGSTLILQRDVISNYSLSECPHIKSSLPPISYSIGVWEPQKLAWLFALMLHLPARIILSMHSDCAASPSSAWTRSSAFVHAHAAFFGIWWGAAMWSMGIIIHLQRLIGQKDNDPHIHRMWWVKIGIMTAFFFVSVGVSIFYPLSQLHCSIAAFTIFCLCEYSVVGLNAAFWGCYLTEIGREYEGFQVTAMRSRKGTIVHPEMEKGNHCPP